jgi:hypothetical protein
MGGVKLAAGDGPFERPIEVRGGAIKARLIDVTQDDRQSGDRHRLGDPSAHEAAADDRDRIDARR